VTCCSHLLWASVSRLSTGPPGRPRTARSWRPGEGCAEAKDAPLSPVETVSLPGLGCTGESSELQASFPLKTDRHRSSPADRLGLSVTLTRALLLGPPCRCMNCGCSQRLHTGSWPWWPLAHQVCQKHWCQMSHTPVFLPLRYKHLGEEWLPPAPGPDLFLPCPSESLINLSPSQTGTWRSCPRLGPQPEWGFLWAVSTRPHCPACPWGPGFSLLVTVSGRMQLPIGQECDADLGSR
jgi:hypothetical protein